MRASPRQARRLGSLLSLSTAVVLVLTGSLVIPDAARAATDCFDYRTHLPLLGSVPFTGDAWDVALAGDYAFVASGTPGLAIVDVSDPPSAHVVATLDTPGIAQGIGVSGSLAVIADGVAGIAVIDVTDPTDPALLATLALPGESRAVAVSGTHAYVAAMDAGMHVIDLASPETPILVATLDTEAPAYDVALSGHYAFVADRWRGVEVIDVTDPANPTFVANIVAASYAVVGIAIEGNRAYLAEAEHPSGLSIVDITDPLRPVHQGFALTPFAYRVDIEGDYAYLVTESSVYAIDVRDPTAPRVVGAVFGPPGGVLALGDRLYAAQSGLRIIDTSVPAAPLLGVRLRGGNLSVSGAAIAGSYAYTSSASLGAGLHVIDLASPGFPVVGFASIPSGEGMRDLVAVNGLLYGTNFDGLHIFDVAVPSAPTLISVTRVTNFNRGLAVLGKTAFVATEELGLWALDVSDSAHPVIIGNLALPGSAWDVAVAGSNVVVASRAAGIHVVDVSDPSAMAIVGSLDTPGEAYGVAVDGTLGYVADGPSGLAVVDLADPTSPLLLGRTFTSDVALNVSVAERIAYVSDRRAGLGVVDVANPSAPRFLGGAYPGYGQYYKSVIPGYAVDVVTNGNVVCVAAGLGGFRIYPPQCAVPVPVALSDLDATSVENGIQLRCQVNVALARLDVLRRIDAEPNAPYAPCGGTAGPIVSGQRWRWLDNKVEPAVAYRYLVVATYPTGETETIGPVLGTALPASVGRLRLTIVPNPGREQFLIRLSSSIAGVVRIVDTAGRSIRRLEVTPQGSGAAVLPWDGRDNHGQKVPAGTYFLLAESSPGKVSGRVTLVR